MAKLMYRGYVRTIAKRVEAELSSIEVGNNFEYGPEFEIVMARTLRTALPDKFGVARGFVVDKDGNYEGDDLIIFDRTRFPTLGLRGRDEDARKEFIPIEAVVCYIEAKHTIEIEGDGPQSLAKAYAQVSKVKELISKRDKVSLMQISPHSALDQGISVVQPEGYPDIRNPSFTVIWAKQVRQKRDSEILNDSLVTALSISDRIEKLQNDLGKIGSPDLEIFGKNCIVIPGVNANNVHTYETPFYDQERHTKFVKTVPNTSFGIGIISILGAIDWIMLGKLPIRSMMTNAINESIK